MLMSVCACVLIIGGCKVGPNYHPPKTDVPASWLGEVGPQTGASPDTMLVKWWTEFNDPNLMSLINRAMISNLDLKLAEQRIRQARAQRGIVASGLYPSVDATGSFTRSRSGPAGRATTSNLFVTGLDSVWELDIFGGVRRGVEAADADIRVTIEDRRDVLVTLAAEVAINYIDLRGFQQEIVIAQDNLKAQQHNADIVRKRYAGGTGFASKLDVANADAQVSATFSQIPVLETSAQQTIYNIAVLLGQHPESMVNELSPASSIPFTPPAIPTGLPSQILRRRPDIRRAEAQIHAATARIGVAVADLFPKFNLAGSFNLSGSDIGSLGWSGRSWSFGPSADWQIFSAGRVKSSIEVQKALQEQTVIAYKQTVLIALQDVENALIAYTKELVHNKALADAVASNRIAVDLSMRLYTEGQTDFLNVLNAQRSLYVADDALVQSTRNLSTDLVALYKALGGGWDSESDQKPQCK